MLKRLSSCFLLIALLVFISCAPDESYRISIFNPSPIDLTEKPVAIERGSLKNLPDTEQYPVVVTERGDTLPSQLNDKDGDMKWDEVFLVADISARDTLNLTVSWVKVQPNYQTRTSVRFGKRDAQDSPVYPKTSDTLFADRIHARLGYQPYQTDGPSWENDKVGFRHYFDGRNARDLFGKRIAAISPETVGINEQGAVEDNYHEMREWGRDILSVGNSVGLGGIALMDGDSILRLGCVSGDTVTNIDRSVFRILNEGPVLSSFTFEHFDWQPVEGKEFDVKETVRIWPGMYAYENTVELTGLSGQPLIVGMVNSNTPKPVTELEVDDWMILYTHDQQGYNREWWIGMALILPKKYYMEYGEAPKTGKFSNTFYGKLESSDNVPVTYYAVGCWELSADQGFADEQYFVDYITNLARQLAVEPVVEVL